MIKENSKEKMEQKAEKLIETKEKLVKLQYVNDVFLDNYEFLKVMNISKRTAQKWRDEETISFSQIGAKIYYRFSDIHDLIDKNTKKSN